MALPDHGRGAHVALAHKHAGDFWRIVDVRPHKPQIAAALRTSLQSASVASETSDAEAATGGAAANAGDDAGSGSDADSEEVVYKGPSGWVLKRRAASAKVYGVKHRGNAPVSSRVRRMRGVYKRSWVLQAPADEMPPPHAGPAAPGQPSATAAPL